MLTLNYIASIAIIAMVVDQHGHEGAGGAPPVDSPAAPPLHKSNNLVDPLAPASALERPPTLAAAGLPEQPLLAIDLANQAAANDSATKVHREPLSTMFPASKKSVKTPLISQERFHWDQVSPDTSGVTRTSAPACC